MMIEDSMTGNDTVFVGYSSTIDEKATWKTQWKAAYYTGDWTAEDIDNGYAGEPSDVRTVDGNILVNTGIALMLDLLIGAGGTVYSNANAYLGVGDSTTAASASQTDLQAASNKLRKAMDATYPSRSSQTLTFRCTYASGDANFSIQEQAVFNASSSGTMLNRKVTDLGTKTSASTLQLTLTITIS
jgi:hypothetical protein